MNKRLANRIKTGKAFDLAYSDRTKEGYYIINHFMPEKDYVNSFTEEEIFSIWKNPKTGKYYALNKEQTDNANFEDYECVWLK